MPDAKPMAAPDAVPLVGREEELSVATAALARGGCLIAGQAGVGKSRLAAEVAERKGRPVERVLATASASILPFGAFSHLSADRSPDPGIPEYLESLRRRFAGDRPTLVVDDAHLLDDASAALLLAIVQTETASTVVTIRSSEGAPDAVVALWKEGLLERLELQQLTRADARLLVDALLGAPSQPSVYARVHELTEGNPLYVRELVNEARRKGALVWEQDRWRLTGVPLPLGRLRELVADRTRDLSDHARTALEFLSLGAPLSLERLRMLASADAVDELEAIGVAVVGRSIDPVVELAHPIYAEVTAEAMPTGTARTRFGELAKLPIDEDDPDDLLRVAVWKLQAGESDESLYLRASRRALQAASGVPRSGWGRSDMSLAIRFAQAAGPGLEASIRVADGLMQVDEFAAVEEKLAPLEDEAGSAGYDLAAYYLRTRVFSLHWGGKGTAAAQTLLDRANGWGRGSEWSVLLASLRGWILLDLGHTAGARTLLELFISLPGVEDRARFELLTVLGLAYGRLGLMDRCEALDPEIQDLADRIGGSAWDTGWAKHMVDSVARTDAARNLDEVAERLYAEENEAEDCGDNALLAAIRTSIGRLELVRGHTASAVRALEAAVDGLSRSDPRNALGLAATYLARAHGLRGEAETGRRVLARASEHAQRRPNNHRLGIELARAAAWIDAAGGYQSSARERLMKAADDAGEDVMGAAEALYGSVRLGVEPSDPADRLASLSNGMENERVEACAYHAQALARGDNDAQLDAAHRFADLGLDLFAAEAAARASESLRREGKRSSAKRAAAFAAIHAQRCEGARTPALSCLPLTVGLTAREREVAELAARGLSNAEIADNLSLSVRSVETYVLRACRKLGVDSRTQLEAALGTRT